jgi:VanZ family protein
VRVLYSADDKWAHAAAFFAVWWALRWALGWRALPLALLSAALGAAVEVHQMYLPGFVPSWADWGADLLGIAAALSLFALWKRPRLAWPADR